MKFLIREIMRKKTIEVKISINNEKNILCAKKMAAS